ncbi:MAG: low molecular weight protein-tyrosine-phosphatase [Bacteroidota bacterium]|jgi:protein-tyrosine phosphatase
MKILMVCLGNICRSPVAEGLMRKIASENNLMVTVDSAGTSGHHNGENPDKRSQRNALKNGVDISGLISRKFKLNDFENFDVIYVMDKSNKRNILQMAKDETQKNKVKMFLGEEREVPDPWYGGEDGFELVFQMIKNRCEEIVKEIVLQNIKPH